MSPISVNKDLFLRSFADIPIAQVIIHPDHTVFLVNLFKEIDDFPLFKPVTRFSARVEQVAQLPEMIRQAFRAATTGSPGPAHLELAGHLGELNVAGAAHRLDVARQAEAEVALKGRLLLHQATKRPGGQQEADEVFAGNDRE